MHWFIDPIKNKYADFNSRATRQEFWMFNLISILICIPIILVETLFDTLIIGWIFTISITVPVFALGARRLHDTGKSGWWQLIGLIPIVGWVIFIVLMSLPSSQTENQYG